VKFLFRLTLLAFLVSLGFSVRGGLCAAAAAAVVSVMPAQAEEETKVVAGVSSVEEDDDDGASLDALPPTETESASLGVGAVVHRPRVGLAASQSERALLFRPPRA